MKVYLYLIGVILVAVCPAFSQAPSAPKAGPSSPQVTVQPTLGSGLPSSQGEPSTVAGLIRKGNALSRQGKWKEAARVYREASALRPDDAVAHYNLATALAGLQQIP
ncbi:MAG: tetratricopeptide repeat protein, partial [Terriglobia bacterium]